MTDHKFNSKPPLPLLLLFALTRVLWPDIALAQAGGAAGAGAASPATLCALEGYFSSAVQAIVGLVGLAALLMLIVGGFKLITSGGEPKAATEARNTLTFAVIGLALTVGAIFILRFIKIFTGVDVLNFKVC